MVKNGIINAVDKYNANPNDWTSFIDIKINSPTLQNKESSIEHA